MSTLREPMDRLREVFIARVPAEIKAVMSGAEVPQYRGEVRRLPSALYSRGQSGTIGHGIVNWYHRLETNG